MKLPSLSSDPTRSSETITTFGGYHHRSTVPDNAFYDETNLSSEHYPALCTRRARGIFKNTKTNDAGETEDVGVTAPSAMLYTDVLSYVDGSALVVGTERIECGLSTSADMLPKRLLSFGAYLIVLPDRYYLNTADHSDCGVIETRFCSRTETLSELWYAYSIDYCDETGSKTDASGDAYDESAGYFLLSCRKPTEAATSAIEERVSLTDTGFYRGQRLTAEAISTNSEVEGAAAIPVLWEISTTTALYAVVLYDISDCVVSMVTEDGLVFKGVPKYTKPSVTDYSSVNGTYSYGFTLRGSPMPDMDFVFEHENRLWGCRYGVNALGEMLNEIYASALGSFRDFHTYEGIASDSFTQSIGSDGPFTGAASVNGYPIFFKERGYHKVYGSYPAEYLVQTVECKGVQRGSERSMAMINGVLFYKAPDCVCSFDGSYPTELSYSLGDCRYGDAVGGGHRSKYYLSMRNTDTDAYSLFVYDARYGIWNREDGLSALCFCDALRTLYCIPSSGDRILDMTGGDGDAEDGVPWSFETGMISFGTVHKKLLRELSVRLSLSLGGVLLAFVEYDSCGLWEYLFRLAGTSTTTFTVPITPQRCDHFRLRFSGTGDVKLFALSKTYTKGSAY